MADSDFTVRKGLLVRDGNVSLRGDNKELRFYEGANYVGFEAPALSADKIWVLPAADGSTGQALKTDGSGNLGWVTAGDVTLTGTQTLTNKTYGPLSSGYVVVGASNDTAAITSNGAHNLFLTTNSNTNSGHIYITDGVNGDIVVTPNGTGSVLVNYPSSANSFAFQVKGNENSSTAATFTSPTTATNAIQTAAHITTAITSGSRTTGFGTQLEFRLGEINYGGYVAGKIGAKMKDTGNSNFDMFITPSGTGNLALGNFTLDADQSVGSGQDNYVMTYDHSAGTIGLEAASGGASDIGALTDVTMDATNFVDSILIQTDSDGSAPTTGTLNTATGNIGIGKDVLESLTEGKYNVVFGYDAGDSITSGEGHVFIGRNAGGAATVGSTGSVMVGDNAGAEFATSSGWPLTAVGSQAGQYMAGANNTFMGHQAGMSESGTTNNVQNAGFGYAALAKLNDGGSYNIAMGGYAGYKVTTGDSNAFLGNNAGYNTTTGRFNIAIGDGAMHGTTGNASERTVAIGYRAGYVLDGGHDNILLGFETGTAITSGGSNIALGKRAAKSITTGSRNIAIGQSALDFADTESDNIAIGYDALGGSVEGGEKNIAIGNNAGDAKTSGSNDVLIGYDAGSGLIAGHSNTFIGTYSGKDSVAVSYNVAIGYGASQNNAQGGRVTSIGGFAGQSGDGNYTVHVGYAAGQYSTGESNTFIGDSAGLWTSGDKNIAIGHNAQGPNLSGDGNVIIGYDIDAPSNSGDRQLIIAGNDGTTTTTWITGDSAGKIKIGALTSPVTEGMLTVSRDDTTATGATLLLLDGDDDANNGPSLKLYRDSSSPADNDALGNIGFTGEDSAGGERTYAKISAIAKDVTSGTNDGALEFKTMVAGTQEIVLELENGAVTINEAYTLPTAVTGANDRVLTAQTDGSTAWAAASAPATAGIKSLGQVYDTESWNVFQAFNVASYTNSLTLNYFASHNAYYLYPFTVPRTGTLDKIHCRCMTAGASGDEITLALYDSNSNGVPEGRAAIGGPTTFDVSSAGYLSVTGINTSVSAGDILWFALTPSFGTWPGTCKLQGSLDGIPSQTGRVLGFGATSIATTGVSRYGTFSGDPPSTHSDNWQYKHGAPTGRFILMWGEYT